LGLGYNNGEPNAVQINIDSTDPNNGKQLNQVLENPSNGSASFEIYPANQPTIFQMGANHNAFEVIVPDANTTVTWNLDGKSATASPKNGTLGNCP
jgi:hypothetical protein